MKILITGINGLLGKALAQHFSNNHEVIGLSLNSACSEYKNYNVDITDKQAVYLTISRINPDSVIHTAAQSNVDECEINPELAYKVNTLGTRNIALACQRFDASLSYISTDYVFSGKHDKTGFKEFDKPNPLSVYAHSKLLGEWHAQHLLNKFQIIRVSWLFGHTRRNFVADMANCFLQNKKYIAASDMASAPTYVNDLAPVIEELLDKGLFGVYHLTNHGFATRAEIARYICNLLQKPQKLVTGKTLKSLKLHAKRPAFSGLDNFNLKLEGLGTLRSWQEAIKDFLIKENIQIKKEMK